MTVGLLSFVARSQRLAQININNAITDELVGGAINAMKTAHGLTFSNGAAPSQLDANGLPASPLTSTQAIFVNISFLDSQTGPSTTWVYKWTPGGDAVHFFNGGWDVTAHSGCTVSSNGFTTTITMTAGTPARVEFTWHTLPGNDLQTQFKAANYAAGSSELILCRLSDEAALTAGQFTTPELRALMADIRAKTFRMMNRSGAFGNNAKWAYRTPVAALGYSVSQYPPGVQGGTISGTDTYTGSAATDTPGIWTANEVYQGTVTNANTITTPTLNIGSRGAKTIVNNQGQALSVGSIAAGSLATFVYDAILDQVIYTSGGITSTTPIEVQVTLANELNVNLWTNIPSYADDAYVSSLATYVRDNLNGSLLGYFEYSNEVWNFSFPQTNWSSARATALGFTGVYHSWYSLRVRQIMGNITTIWASRSATLRRVIAWQAFGDSSVTYNRLNSGELAPSGTSTGTGNALYSSYTGSANYTTQGQRAVDFADVGAYATYFSGGSFQNSSAYGSVTPYSVSVLQALATAFQSNANDPTSLAAVDNDFRQGTTSNITISSVSGTTINATAHGFVNNTKVIFMGTIPTGLSAGKIYYVVSAATNSFSVSASWAGSAIAVSGSGGTVGKIWDQCLLALSQSIYQNANGNANPIGWEQNAATYDAYRTGAGQSLLSIELYEGGLEAIAPTPSACDTIGVVLNVTPINSITGNVLNVTTNLFSTNDQVSFTNVGSLTGVATLTNYFVVSATPTSFSVSLTQGGAAVTLGGTAGGAAVGSGTAASATLVAGLAAYKNSSYGRALVLSQFNQFMGTDPTDQNFGLLPHSKVPSWFILTGGNQWSLMTRAIDSATYQTYNGYTAFVRS
jgi:hypothetical protein